MVTFRHFHKGLLVVLLAMITPAGSLTSGQESQPSVESITEALRRVEQRLQHLRIRYTYEGRGYVGGRLVKMVGQSRYAHRLGNNYPDMQLFIDWTSYWIDPNTMAKKPYQSFLLARDGKVTRVLVRVDPAESQRSGLRRGLMQGYVYKGLGPSYLYLLEDPFRSVFWGGRDRLLSQVLEEGRYKVLGMGQWEGCSTVILEYRFDKDPNDPNTHEGYQRIWICPERGFLPVRRQFVVDGKMFSEWGLFDLIRLADGVWYPQRIQIPAGEIVGQGEYYPRILRIEEISLEPIPDSFFTFEFPPGTRVYDEVEGINYTTY